MATRGSKWQKTPFRDHRDKLVDLVVETFPWTVDDVLGNPERT